MSSCRLTVLCRRKHAAQVLRVLELIQRNLLRGTLVTKRDIYYQSLSLFPSQSASDRIISQLVTLLGCTDRLELGIVGSPRGILSGSLQLSPPSSSSTSPQVYNCTLGQTTLIPTEITEAWRIDLPCPHSGHHVVLIVEKEAVFKHLLQATTIPAQILITGKGYPDRATAKLVQLLSNHRCSHCGSGMDVRGLFDGDPYGVDVWRQYRLHSAVRWVGVDVRDFEEKGEGLVGLRNDERRTAVRLLRGLSGNKEEEQEVKMRLTEMLLGGYKVEIEAAYDFVVPAGEKGLVAYMEHKLARG
ncbi:topoisomerase acting in meiosis [Pseudozyma hubeiensis SY62]|uniref:DNA topoisomerase (ATP-hydrolyzing) n=1 Tax=Pseudozyma hubeiensis (strain SY62) TaxID=1305764 RepID=R9PEQ3_PSEHS|nr:topoisomerase acting in meiosis [Pseudozyma hubeiensis SY62]GAC99834.1 topoisomerase acting in meiosis [Pseudozyma hubeiensis SY62]